MRTTQKITAYYFLISAGFRDCLRIKPILHVVHFVSCYSYKMVVYLFGDSFKMLEFLINLKEQE